jgi:hypothetical protein
MYFYALKLGSRFLGNQYCFKNEKRKNRLQCYQIDGEENVKFQHKCGHNKTTTNKARENSNVQNASPKQKLDIWEGT